MFKIKNGIKLNRCCVLEAVLPQASFLELKSFEVYSDSGELVAPYPGANHRTLRYDGTRWAYSVKVTGIPFVSDFGETDKESLKIDEKADLRALAALVRAYYAIQKDLYANPPGHPFEDLQISVGEKYCFQMLIEAKTVEGEEGKGLQVVPSGIRFFKRFDGIRLDGLLNTRVDKGWTIIFENGMDDFLKLSQEILIVNDLVSGNSARSLECRLSRMQAGAGFWNSFYLNNNRDLS
ncbi:hypothetical protein ACYPKM_01830 [Pseudomonas aeruginosa]